MADPRVIEIEAPAVRLTALVWGPEEGPIALCLHGFPDTPHGFRTLAPHLVAAGYRVVAPFMRGYAPSGLPIDGAYHIGAIMDDALRVHAVSNPTADDVVIGHDWGALAANGLAAMPDSPFRKAVIMSVPPAPTLRRAYRRWLPLLPGQLRLSWYMGYFQLPVLAERARSWIVPRLWRRWSPNYEASEDIRHVMAAIGSPDNWRAALGTYRTNLKFLRPPAQYAERHRWWTEAPQLPTLYLHGEDDGCMTAKLAPFVRPVLPPGSDVGVVERAGHFLQLDRPDEIGRRIVEFLR